MTGSFKTALIAAVVSAFVAAGAAVATTKTFVLGTTNTVDAASTVTAGSGLNAKLLQLTNNSTGSSATALGLTTPNSRPPMIVSSQARVANLNADKLDGIDSAGFVHGRGTALANRMAFLTTQTETKTLLDIPGLGYLKARCLDSQLDITYWNNTGGPVDAWVETFIVPGNHFAYFVAADGSASSVAREDSGGGDGATIVLGKGLDPAARRTALLHAYVAKDAGTGLCTFQVQGTLWTSQ